MNEDIDSYTIQLKKTQNLIFIFISSKYKINIDYCLAKFDPHLNRYYISEIFTKSASEILVYHNIIEQINQDSVPEFVLTKQALISLL